MYGVLGVSVSVEMWILSLDLMFTRGDQSQCRLSSGDHRPTEIRDRHDSTAEHHVLSEGHIKGQSILD